MKFIGTYSCGYCGHDEIHAIIADSQSQAENFMQEGFYEYIIDNEYIVEREYEGPEETWYESQEYNDFYENCFWDLHEATEEEIEDLGLEKEDWEDVRE